MSMYEKHSLGWGIILRVFCTISLGLLLGRGTVKAAPATQAEVDRLLAEGDQQGAITGLESIRRLESENVRARRELVKLYLWNGRGGDVIPVLEELVRLEPLDDQLKRDLAQHYIWNARAPDAALLYAAIADKHPKNEDIRRKLVQVYL